MFAVARSSTIAAHRQTSGHSSGAGLTQFEATGRPCPPAAAEQKDRDHATSRFSSDAAIAVALLAATPTAEAETRQACAKRDQVVRKLEQKFGETLRSIGLHQSDGVVEIYSSEETGTWTILMTRPDGTTCLLASGQLWEQDAAPLQKPGEPA